MKHESWFISTVATTKNPKEDICIAIDSLKEHGRAFRLDMEHYKVHLVDMHTDIEDRLQGRIFSRMYLLTEASTMTFHFLKRHSKTVRKLTENDLIEMYGLMNK